MMKEVRSSIESLTALTPANAARTIEFRMLDVQSEEKEVR
jgi:hypothetical protein